MLQDQTLRILQSVSYTLGKCILFCSINYFKCIYLNKCYVSGWHIILEMWASNKLSLFTVWWTDHY